MTNIQTTSSYTQIIGISNQSTPKTVHSDNAEIFTLSELYKIIEQGNIEAIKDYLWKHDIEFSENSGILKITYQNNRISIILPKEPEAQNSIQTPPKEEPKPTEVPTTTQDDTAENTVQSPISTLTSEISSACNTILNILENYGFDPNYGYDTSRKLDLTYSIEGNSIKFEDSESASIYNDFVNDILERIKSTPEGDKAISNLGGEEILRKAIQMAFIGAIGNLLQSNSRSEGHRPLEGNELSAFFNGTNVHGVFDSLQTILKGMSENANWINLISEGVTDYSDLKSQTNLENFYDFSTVLKFEGPFTVSASHQMNGEITVMGDENYDYSNFQKDMYNQFYPLLCEKYGKYSEYAEFDSYTDVYFKTNCFNRAWMYACQIISSNSPNKLGNVPISGFEDNCDVTIDMFMQLVVSYFDQLMIEELTRHESSVKNNDKTSETPTPINILGPEKEITNNGPNGEIDEVVSLGWGLQKPAHYAGIFALSSTEGGKEIIKEAIKLNLDGSVTVTFKGVNKSYTISADEIAKYDTDNSQEGISAGDNDMLVLDLAFAKLAEDIRNGVIDRNSLPYSSSYYDYEYRIGNFSAEQTLYFLSGKTCEMNWYDNGEKSMPKEEVYAMLQRLYENNGDIAMVIRLTALDNPYTYDESTGSWYSNDGYLLQLTNGNKIWLDVSSEVHLAIKSVTSDTVTFYNLSETGKVEEYTVSWDEFARLNIYLTYELDTKDF